jgi:phosphoglycolate phosphatase-like HAD superfamily hydrolase
MLHSIALGLRSFRFQDCLMDSVIIFDLDGTLVEFPHEYLFCETQRILEAFSHPPIERIELEASFAAFEYFRFVEDTVRAEFIRLFNETFDYSKFPPPTPLAGVRETLEHLARSGRRLGIATGRIGNEQQICAELRSTGLLEHVSFVAARKSGDTHWGDKRGQLRLLLSHFGVGPEQASMVGDIPSDISSAKELGFGCTVAVLSGGIAEDVLRRAGPTHLVHDIRDLAQLF